MSKLDKVKKFLFRLCQLLSGLAMGGIMLFAAWSNEKDKAGAEKKSREASK